MHSLKLFYLYFYRECERNASVYEVLGIESDSMSEYAAQFNMPERVRQLADSIVLTSDIVIVTPEAKKQLMALAASPLNTIDLSVYTAVVSLQIYFSIISCLK